MEINIHNKRTSNPIDGVYIGRPSVLGNPFSHLKGTLADYSVSSRDEAVDRYETWLRSEIKTNKVVIKEMRKLYKKFVDSGHLNLVCWCHPARCHGDVIKKLILEKHNNGN